MSKLHAQMQADIALLCGPADLSKPGMNDHQESRWRRVQSMPMAKGMALERDPAYLAQMRARKAELQAQAVLLQAHVSDLGMAGAAD
jgi:hypothetical protein